jgi:hypothetical protein
MRRRRCKFGLIFLFICCAFIIGAVPVRAIAVDMLGVVWVRDGGGTVEFNAVFGNVFWRSLEPVVIMDDTIKYPRTDPFAGCRSFLEK